MDFSEVYVGWVEDLVYKKNSKRQDIEYVLIDLLHPDDVLALLFEGLNFAELVDKGEQEGLKTLPIVLRGDQLTKEWMAAIITVAADPQSRLAVRLGVPPSSDVGAAEVALMGWVQESVDTIHVKSIEIFPNEETKKIEKALQSANYMAMIAPKSTTPGGFIRDVVDWCVGELDQIYAAVYDVGQGSASAMVDRNEHPRVFFDIGAPLARFNNTRPKNIPSFFQCDIAKAGQQWLQAPVILSHWDFDHWAGVIHSFHVTNKGGKKHAILKLVPGALNRFWIVPDQARTSLGVTHIELIRRLAKSQSPQGVTALQYWPAGLAWLQFSHGVIVKAVPDHGVTRDARQQRNNSGLVLLITHPSRVNISPVGLLLQGDARRNSIPLNWAGVELVGLVVSHHGGKMGGVPSVPDASRSHLVAAICSVGGPNHAGKKPYGHPTPHALRDHWDAGWNVTNFTFNRASVPNCNKKLGNFGLSLDDSFPC